MVIISHRGNTNGTNIELENSPAYIDSAISNGFDVEIDIRYLNGNLYLGHDEPEIIVSYQWLYDRSSHLWIHAKDVLSLRELLKTDLRVFFHEKESHTIVNNSYGLIWTHDLDQSQDISIIPLLSYEDINLASKYKHVAGICSDYVELLK